MTLQQQPRNSGMYFQTELVMFKMLLHNYVYNDQTCLNILFEYISGEFELFNLSYDPIRRYVDLKIKKTNIKKNPNFAHKVEYYYPIFKWIFIRFINNEYVQDCIKRGIDSGSKTIAAGHNPYSSIGISGVKESETFKHLIENTLGEVLNSNNDTINTIYNIILVSDNSITIQL